jgi:CRISPR/Cas system Type II protein with McrA/HNH and RuvC-like nuclease domain
MTRMSNSVLKENRVLVYEKQDKRCLFCNKHMKHPNDLTPNSTCDTDPTVEHVFPASAGYSHVKNWVLTCRECNERKSDRFPTPCELLAVEVFYDTKLNAWFQPELLAFKRIKNKKDRARVKRMVNNKIYSDYGEFKKIFCGILKLKQEHVMCLLPQDIYN